MTDDVRRDIMADILEGYVERIVFRNPDNGYTVLSLSNKNEDDLTCVGTFTFSSEGEYIRAEGTYTSHSLY